MTQKISTPYDDITYKVIASAMEVHNGLGPGFPEEFYQRALAAEMEHQGLSFEREKPLEIFYREISVGLFYLDFLVEDAVVVEVKALGKLDSLHLEQVISYLVATGRGVGLLINFGTLSLQHRRILVPQRVQESPAYQQRLLEWKRRSKKSTD